MSRSCGFNFWVHCCLIFEPRYLFLFFGIKMQRNEKESSNVNASWGSKIGIVRWIYFMLLMEYAKVVSLFTFSDDGHIRDWTL